MVAIVNLEQMCTKICGRRTCTCSRGGWKQQKLRAGRDLYRTGPGVGLWMCSVLGAGCFPSDPAGLFPLPQAHRCALPWCGTSHICQMSLALMGMCCEVQSPSGFRCVLGRCISIVPGAYGCKSCWKSYSLDQHVGSLWQSLFPGKFVLVSGSRERECSVSLQKDLPIDQECRFWNVLEEGGNSPCPTWIRGAGPLWWMLCGCV